MWHVYKAVRNNGVVVREYSDRQAYVNHMAAMKHSAVRTIQTDRVTAGFVFHSQSQ